MDRIVEGTWKIVSFWECQQCFGLLDVNVEEVRCDYCHPPEPITVTSEEFQKDASKYIKLADERTVRVVSGPPDKECVMSIGKPSRMR